MKIKTDDEGQPLLGADGQPVPIGTEEEGPKHDLTPIGMFLQAHMVVKVVMILLVLMSVATWSYLFAKLGYFSSLNGATRRSSTSSTPPRRWTRPPTSLAAATRIRRRR